MKRYIFILLVIIGASAAQAQKDPRKWTLRQCVDYALEHNIQIEQSRLDGQDALSDKLSAIGNLLPAIDFGVNHSWNNGLNQNIITGLLENATTQYTSLNSNVRVMLFSGLQNIRRLHRANLQILARQYEMDDLKDNTTLMVVNSYIQILFDKESIKMEEYSRSIVESDAERISALVEAGSVPEGDLLEIDATLSENKQSLQNAKNRLRISKLNLAQLLRLNYIEIEDFDENIEPIESSIALIPPNDIYKKSLDFKNNIKAAETNLRIAKKDLQISKGGYYPILTGNLRYNTRASYSDRITGRVLDQANPTSPIGVVENTNQSVVRPNYKNIIGRYKNIFNQFEDNDGFFYGLNLSIPILSGLNTRSKVQKSKINIERQKLRLEKLKFDLKSDVYKAWNDLKMARKAYKLSKKTQLSRKKAFEYAKSKFKEGVIQPFEYTQALHRFEIANRNLIIQKFNFIFKGKVLEYYFNIRITDQL